MKTAFLLSLVISLTRMGFTLADSEKEYRICSKSIDGKIECIDVSPGYYENSNIIISIKELEDSVAVFWSLTFEHNIAETSIWIKHDDSWRLQHTEPSQIGNSTISRHYVKVGKNF